MSTVKPKKWKPSRKDTEQVQIDGVTQSWKQFKQAHDDDVKTKKIQNRQWVMNLGKSNEKLLKWNFKRGYESEDSENE